MKHYKDNKNNIYAYKKDGSEDKFIKEGLIQIDNKEVAEIQANKKAEIEANPETKKQKIFSELAIIDKKSIRTLRENNADRLKELEDEAAALREKLQTL